MKNPEHKKLRFGIQSSQTLRRIDYRSLFDDNKLGNFINDVDNSLINSVSEFPVDVNLTYWTILER